MIYHKTILDFQKHSNVFRPICYIKQNDSDSHSIVAQLLDNGKEYVPPEGALVTFRYKKADGTIGFYDSMPDGQPAAIVNGSVITMLLAEQALTAPGAVDCELNLYTDDGEKLTTFTFRIMVEGAALTDAQIVSTDYFNVLTVAIEEAMNAAQDAKSEADRAEAEADRAEDALEGAMMKSVYDQNGDGVVDDSKALDGNSLEQLLSIIYPVGSIYLSVNSESPSVKFGGEWEAWGSGRVPVGVDLGQTEFESVEKQGGAKTQVFGLSSGSADIGFDAATGSWQIYAKTPGKTFTSNRRTNMTGGVGIVTETKTGVTGTPLSGSTDAGSVLQPYITCYMWKRTA